jgi:hypothetical protein
VPDAATGADDGLPPRPPFSMHFSRPPLASSPVLRHLPRPHSPAVCLAPWHSGTFSSESDKGPQDFAVDRPHRLVGDIPFRHPPNIMPHHPELFQG